MNYSQASIDFAIESLKQIASTAKSKEQGYLDRKTCAKLAAQALIKLGIEPKSEACEAESNAEALHLDAQSLTAVGHYTIYTDGGCKGNPGPAGWGIVVTAEDGAILCREGNYIGTATNQVAELTAALEGLRKVPAGSTVLLISDSQYTLKGLTEWRLGWEARGYRNSAGDPVSNLSLWKALYAEADQRNVRVQWVKGHSGHLMNELCDQLANKAISSRSRVN